MQNIIQLIAALFGALGFAAFFNIRGKKLIFATLGGVFAWGSYLIAGCFTDNPFLCAFAASVLLTLYSECMARIHKTPVTLFIVSSAIILIPGASLYRSMNNLMRMQWQEFGKESMYTLLFAASMSAGITFTTLVFRVIWKAVYRQRRY
ncbi:MAG: threonine/serine exporter family protein [Lachnospiraceae bacterium]|nr:threonine/serine exporter family protein [Lachnospiraceae bacterium]